MTDVVKGDREVTAWLLQFRSRRRVRSIESALRGPVSAFFCGDCCDGRECLNPRCPGSKLRRTLAKYPGHERRIAEIAVQDYGA